MTATEIQFDLFAPAITDAAETLQLMRPHKWAHGPMGEMPLVAIELEPTEGRWMWAACLNSRNGAAQGYKALPKWGKFAESKPAALLKAIDEVQGFIHRAADDERERINEWLSQIASSAIATHHI